MESRITHFCLIQDFLGMGFDTNKINEILKMEVNSILSKNSFTNKNDWVINFQANYNNGTKLLISKNKFGTYSKDKIKQIFIPIPIPTNVSWGVKTEQHTYEATHYDKIINNFWVLDVNFSDFQNREEYILDCMRRAIKKAFEEGFTVGGIKVKDYARQ